MKKLIYLIIVVFSFISCNENEYTIQPEVSTSEENIVIKDGWNGFKYKKTIVENHEYYFRTWATRGGYGSDLVHNPNCSFCNKKDSLENL